MNFPCCQSKDFGEHRDNVEKGYCTGNPARNAQEAVDAALKITLGLKGK